jgi:hypothetical protein
MHRRLQALRPPLPATGNHRTLRLLHPRRPLPRGLAHPATTHGRFSKDLPTRLVAQYRASLDDPEILALREEMALLTARETDFLQRVQSGETGTHWGSAQHAIAGFRLVHQTSDATAASTLPARASRPWPRV